MNQIARCDWLPERATGGYLARWRLIAVSREKNLAKSQIINHLLTKLVRSRWLDIGLVLFFASLWTSTPSWSINTQKNELGQYLAILTSYLVNKQCQLTINLVTKELKEFCRVLINPYI